MINIGRAALLFVVSNLVAPPGQLSVIRAFPTKDVEPRSEVTITFDRPVAGGLDATIDARTIFSITPSVPGRVEWRDPITLRFKPSVPFTPGQSYRVVVENTFTAMDGSRMQEPFSYTFKVNPPRVLHGDPVSEYNGARFLGPRPVLNLLLSSPVDPRVLTELISITMSKTCGGTRIPVELVRMRRVRESDQQLRYYGIRYDLVDDTARDLRRVAEIRPVSNLPRGCAGTLNVPLRLQPGDSVGAWGFSTYGALSVISARCGYEEKRPCPTGPVVVTFSTPVRGAEVLRHVRMAPALKFEINDTSEVSDVWTLDVKLTPRQSWAVVVDSMLTDIFGQRLGKTAVKAFATTSFTPRVVYDFGKMLVERNGMRTIAAQVVNVDTLIVTTIAVPESAEASFLSQTWRWNEPFEALRKLAVDRRIGLKPELDKPFVAGIKLPANDARVTRNGTLIAMKIRPARGGTNTGNSGEAPVTLVQVTNLAIHGKMALDGGMVWVTGVNDGKPRPGAVVHLYNSAGKQIANARTDAQGLARFPNVRTLVGTECEECNDGFEGYVAATLLDDRAVVGFNSYDPDLAPWRFGISSAWSEDQRTAAAGAVFVERGIYRPGERVYAKAIVRDGTLGSLIAPRADSVKWVFTDREAGVMKDTVMKLSSFGTAEQSLVLGTDVPLGEYRVNVSIKRAGDWRELAATFFQVAEYRPPEFLVDVNADTRPRFGGDTMTTNIAARYLFGAPMAGAQVRLLVQTKALSPWENDVPIEEGYEIGGYDYTEDYYYEEPQTTVVEERIDTLDARGQLNLSVKMPETKDGRGMRTGVIAVVTDANRQAVTAGTSVIVHPASFYIGVKPRGDDYFWRAGVPVTLDVLTVSPTGARVSGVNVSGVVIRREWHRVRRVRGGDVSDMGGWVSDTVATCSVRTAAQPASCQFTPVEGGQYTVVMTAKDERGRTASTTVYRWAAGKGYVPWNDDTQLKVDIIADKQRYSVGDTATLLIASPFTDVEAWLTIERERVLESRRIRLVAGAMTVKVPITEALAPNAFVGIVIVRGRSAAPGPMDDPGRPALRVGFTELRVLPAVKKLTVTVAPFQPEYRPGDDASIRVNVKNVNGGGERAEVTLWAVDEGVLALTGYQLPDPLALIYRERSLGVRLASNLTNVAKQVPEGMKGKRNPGGGGGADIAGVLRSRFQTTAFFLGNVVTDANGNAVATAKLPDNLTTFRIMAVAVTAGDRYGSGQSSMIVTRPLVARPSLPRFVRDGDRFSAGVVVNQRAAGNQKVEVEATARGIALSGSKKKSETLNGSAGREVRFDFTAQQGDSAHFQFAVRGGENIDAVAVRIPVKPSYHPLAQTIAGAVTGTDTAVFTLEQNVDPARSVLEISFGGSTLAVIRGTRNVMRVYPYYCSEQISSNVLPLIALYRAQQQLGVNNPALAHAEADIRTAIRVLTRRQRADGGIGYWSSTDWSTPWLTAYAARVLMEAKAAGFAIDDAMLGRMGSYLQNSLQEQPTARFAISRWYANNIALALSDRVMAVDVLSRMGRPEVPAENTLLGQAGQLRWEDRVLLAEVLARRGAIQPARQLLAVAWQSTRVDGRKITMPIMNGRDHYFESAVRPFARLLSATLAIDPAHAQMGALVETLVEHGRRINNYYWNTQDYGSLVLALLDFERLRKQGAAGTIRIAGAKGTLITRDVTGNETRDTTFALTGLVSGNTVPITVTTSGGTLPVYYYLTVREVPKTRPLNPIDRGIQVERWYERIDNRQPIMRIAAGELVRVRLRIRIPTDREFVILDDPLPAGLEAVDLSLRTVRPPGLEDFSEDPAEDRRSEEDDSYEWYFGSWDSGVWSAFDHKELRDDRVIYFATYLWQGVYTATYLARATTPGTFAVPPAHAEEMYNPGVNGRTGGGEFVVTLPGSR